jgi:hypothetical protein
MKMIWAFSVLLFQIQSGAADFFLTKNNLWFDSSDNTRVDAIVELSGVPKEQVRSVLAEKISGPTLSKITVEDLEPSKSVRISLHQMNHAELLLMKSLLPSMKALGAAPLSPEIPFAIRVHNLRGHDSFVAEVSGLPLKTVQEIDQVVTERQLHGSSRPIIVRYFLDDREHEDPKDYKILKAANGDAIVTHIPANLRGQMPLYVPGQSIVYQTRTFHGQNILGKINPGLVNAHIAQALTANKYVESLFWEKYAPGALPETHLLALMNLPLNDVAALVQALNQRFPEGWVMKGINESSSNFSIITDKTKLIEEIQSYQKSDFEKFKKKTYKDLAGFDEDNIYEALQEHKNYFGWRASQYLQNPRHVIVQRKVNIDREFRVESVGGRILKGATVDRHNWYLESKGLPFTVSAPELIDRIEAYTQTIVDKLPPSLRETNFAFDIALLKNNQFVVIESNAGSESGFLANQAQSTLKLNEFLNQYPELKSKGQVRGYGMSPEAQMSYLRTQFREWGVDVHTQYPQYQFTDTEVQTGTAQVLVKAEFNLKSHGGEKFCPAVL